MKTIIEPFRIKSVEPIRHTTVEQREAFLRAAGFNPFLIDAENVLIDLLTDSGTGAMSSEQWAGMMRGDESYAGAVSFRRFERTMRELTGYDRVLPTHQGRASERILFELIGGPGRVIPNNAHFDTTRANAEHSGAEAVNLPIPEALDPRRVHPFKGNLNVPALVACIEKAGADRVPAVMVTVTNNSCGGQPVSLANLRDPALFARASNLLILTEGYVTYGGLSGRDLEAMAQGFREVVEEDYLAYRIRSTAYLGEKLLAGGVDIVRPPGGHAIYLDAASFCPHLPPEQFPGQAVVCGLYRHAGIRAVEIGSLMFGGEGRLPPPLELVRLAIPRRVYTQSHIDYVAEAALELHASRGTLRGLRIVEASDVLRHFTARLAEI